MSTEQVIPAGFGHVVHRWSLAGKSTPVSVGHGFELAADVVVANPAALASTFMTLMGNTDRPGASASMLLDNVYLGCTVNVRYLTELLTGEAISNNYGTYSITGGQVTEALTGLISERTALAGRKHRGRMYVPLTKEIAAQVGPTGLLNSLAVTRLSTDWGNYFADCDDAELPFHILHTSVNGASVPAPTPVVSIQLRSKVAVQRRRLR